MYWNWSIGLALAILPIFDGHSQESLSQPTNAAPAVKPEATTKAAAPAPAAPNPALAAPTAENDVVDAPAKPMSTSKPLPPSVRPTAPVAEVIKLADSGVEECVMLAFVTNSTSTFNLGAEEIIYLNDIGVPSAVVTAMIQRDQTLRELPGNMAPAAVAPAPAVPAPYPSEPAPAPAPEEMAPQPDYATESYPPPADNSYASYYDTLAPYGTWVDVAGYGPCWQPTVEIVNPGWQPYCNGGRWVYTDCGWYWLSGYSWGWAPFHYGRWFCHSQYGWCWVPGNVWGPSWVCWRYNGNYCGWAPLPPAAGFHAGVGLTYHGQHVNGSFAFGLGARSYTFVPVSHFSDRHLHHYALPRVQAAQVYNQTAPSSTIVGNSTRVVNRGIPVARVEAASQTHIRPVSIREVNTSGAQGTRGERLEANSRTFSVFRPQFSQPAGTQPAYGARARSDIRSGSGSAGVAPAPAAPKVAPVSAPRTPIGSPATQPNSGGGSGRRTDRSINQTYAAPPGSLIVIGKKEGSPSQTTGLAAASATQTSWSRTTAPAYQAPVETPRSAPAQSYTQPHMQSYSPPAPSPAPRVEPTVSQPVHSAPSAPAPSAPATHSESSSGRNGR